MTPLTEQEIRGERTYRYQERLGILCGSEPVTPEARLIAQAEADQWEREYRAQGQQELL